MSVFIQAVQLILSLSILVIIHEFGHFFFAKLFKTRVEKFYLFFNPGFSLFKFKKGDTEYGMGWLPLGGYVKISGMIDESMDREQMKQPAKPWEFRSKPAYQRLLIMLGGVTVNFIAAMLIFWMLVYVNGETYLPNEAATYGYAYHEIGKDFGLEDGDIITAVGDKKIEVYTDVLKELVLDNSTQMTILRNGKYMSLTIPDEFSQIMLRRLSETPFSWLQVPFVADSVVVGYAAHKAGFLRGDSIVSINEEATPYFHNFVKTIGNFKGDTVSIGVYRNGEKIFLETLVSKQGKIGVMSKGYDAYFHFQRFKYGLGESFVVGINKGVGILGDYIKQMKLIFTKEGAKQVGGFGSMGKIFTGYWNWDIFWTNTAFISLILAFMNILPIPGLDGGHVIFLLWEIIAGRKPSDKFMEKATMIGIILLFSLLIYANMNDLVKWIGK